jgi:hypothetical protein
VIVGRLSVWRALVSVPDSHRLRDKRPGRSTAGYRHGNGHRELAYPILVLTLAYESDHWFVYPLVVISSWLEIRRGLAAQDHRYGIPLPNYLNAVPAGALPQLLTQLLLAALRKARA